MSALRQKRNLASPRKADVRRPIRDLKTWIDRFAFQGQDREDAFVDAAQRFSGHKPFQRLVPEGELAEGEVAFSTQPALAQADEILRRVILGAVDDALLRRPQVVGLSFAGRSHDG